MRLRRLLLIAGAAVGGLAGLSGGAMFALGVDPLLVLDRIMPAGVEQAEHKDGEKTVAGGGHSSAAAPGNADAGKTDAASHADGHGAQMTASGSHAAADAPANGAESAGGGHGGTAGDEKHAASDSASDSGHGSGHGAEKEGDGTVKATRGDHPAEEAGHEHSWAEKLPQGESQPWAVFRRLQFAQDDIVSGKPGALDGYRLARAEAAGDILAAPPEAWLSRRNVLAAAALAMAGGNTGIAREVIAALPPDSDLVPILEASIAYVEGDYFSAYPVFDRLDIERLPASLRGQFALVKAMLLAQAPPEMAVAAFERTRSYAPSTLIEETALRRLIRLHSQEGNRDGFMRVLSTYLRRFPQSAYLEDFLRNGATGFVRLYPEDPLAAFDQIYSRMAELEVAPRRMFLTLVARTAVIFGYTDLARKAGEEALALGGSSDPRLRLYLAAARVEDPAFGTDIGALSQEFDNAALNGFDRRLWNAVKLVAGQIDTPLPPPVEVGRAPPEEGTRSQAPVSGSETATGDDEFDQFLSRARDMLRQGDEALSW
jgi:chemotaxis protein MotC